MPLAFPSTSWTSMTHRSYLFILFFFFFQAEDGIRDLTVTGVQTCALPVNEGRPNIADHIKSGEISLVINTPLGRVSRFDEQAIRRAALQYNVPCVTTMTGAQALVEAIAASAAGATPNVRSLQQLHAMRASMDAVSSVQ